MGAALAELVASRAQDDGARAEAASLRTRLLALADADAEAYARVLERGGDSHGEATDIPFEIATTAADVARLAASLREAAPGALAGDAAAAVTLALAAARGSAQLVLVNLGDDADDPRAVRARELVGGGD